MKIERFEDIEIWKDAKPLGVNRLTFGVVVRDYEYKKNM